MTLLVRKIEQAKWLQKDIKNGEDASADAITNCMKTTQNTLSTWKINDATELEHAVLAIVSNHHHLDAIDVVCFDRDGLEKEGISLIESPGITAYEKLKDQHVDIANLSYKSLGIVAGTIIEEFKKSKIKRYTKNKIKQLLSSAIESGELDIKQLSDSLKKKL